MKRVLSHPRGETDLAARAETKHQPRRYEHWIHAKYCRGEYDHLMSSAEASARRSRCETVCGLCRRLNSLPA
jgi:hypothetical protein